MIVPIKQSLSHLVSVNGAYVHVLLNWLDQHNIAAPELRAAVMEIKAGDKIGIHQWKVLLERAAALRPGDSIGLEIGSCVAPEHVGILGYLVLACDNMAQAIDAYQRFEALFYGMRLAQISFEDDYVDISWPISMTESLGLLIDETSIAALVKFVKKLVPQSPDPILVTFSNPAPENAAVYESFFACPVLFNEPVIKVRFPLSSLSVPLPTANPVLHELLDSQAQALARVLPGSYPFAQEVQQMMLKTLPSINRPTLKGIASALGLSPRSVQRRLKTHDLSFQQLLDRTREELAKQYLLDPSVSIIEIALLLGFAEQSSFQRFFRTATGESPGKWRGQQPGQ